MFDRGSSERGEQEIPDRVLQLRMLEDALDYNGDPGIVVLLTGDGAGYTEGADFHSTLERMHRRGWRVEILSWAHSCNQRMRRWAEENGVFVALDDFYETITFMEPSRPGFELAQGRGPLDLDLSRRLCRLTPYNFRRRPSYSFLRWLAHGLKVKVCQVHRRWPSYQPERRYVQPHAPVVIIHPNLTRRLYFMPESVDPTRLRLTNEEGSEGVLLGLRCRDCDTTIFGSGTFCQQCTSARPGAGGVRSSREPSTVIPWSGCLPPAGLVPFRISWGRLSYRKGHKCWPRSSTARKRN